MSTRSDRERAGGNGEPFGDLVPLVRSFFTLVTSGDQNDALEQQDSAPAGAVAARRSEQEAAVREERTREAREQAAAWDGLTSASARAAREDQPPPPARRRPRSRAVDSKYVCQRGAARWPALGDRGRN